MIQQRLLFSSLVAIILAGINPAMAEEKQPAAPATVSTVTTATVKADTTKVISDKPMIKFATPKAAVLGYDKDSGQAEPIKFNLGYDQDKVVSEIEKAKPKNSQYPSHKFAITPSNDSYSGTYDYKGTLNIPTTQKSQSFSSSNMGADATYLYSPNAETVYEVSASYFTAGATAVTNTTSPKIVVLDTKSSTVQTFGRANYCYFTFSNGSRICPGLELVYDSYSILNTTNTGTTIATLEMQKAMEISGGANIYAEVPFYNNFNARFRAGYIVGTGMGRSGVVGSQNIAGYSNADVDWKILPQHSATLGVSYLSRTAVTDSANMTMKSLIVSVGYIFELGR